jgi:hypothetical protein
MGTVITHPILETHVGGPTVDLTDVGIARLGASLDEESDRLFRLAEFLQRPEIGRVVADLGTLHREPEQSADTLLAEAEVLLLRLLDALRGFRST